MAKAKAVKKPAKRGSPGKAGKPQKPEKAKAVTLPPGHALRRERFVAEYLVDSNATQAAIRAGYSPKTAYAQGCRLLKDAEIAKRVEQGVEKIAERLQLTTEGIAEHLARIITADPNELIEYRRECCRYCWGEGFKYQYTPQEQRDREAQYLKDRKAAENKGNGASEGALLALGEWDPRGGIGYNRKRPPNPECPECFGEGEERPYAKDTRNLSPEAGALYSGVKVTKEGLEIKMHDKAKALELYGKHLGMFREKVQLSNDPENPLRLTGLSDEELMAIALGQAQKAAG